MFSKAAFENSDLARDWICLHTLISDEEQRVSGSHKEQWQLVFWQQKNDAW